MAQAIPAGYHTVTPSLTFKDSKTALEFYTRAFSATVLDLFPNPAGTGIMHATFQVGTQPLMRAMGLPWRCAGPGPG